MSIQGWEIEIKVIPENKAVIDAACLAYGRPNSKLNQSYETIALAISKLEKKLYRLGLHRSLHAGIRAHFGFVLPKSNSGLGSQPRGNMIHVERRYSGWFIIEINHCVVAGRHDPFFLYKRQKDFLANRYLEKLNGHLYF